jgi:monomeric isocitrate dehydrogenase
MKKHTLKETSLCFYRSKKELCVFLEEQIADAKTKGVLFSVHLKATMMKVRPC